MNYEKAKVLADRLVEILGPHCDRIHIAGSIRRMKPEVKDIEIVCQPKQIEVQEDIFSTKKVVLPEFIKAIELVTDKIVKGKPDGRYMQIILKGGFTLDLFMPLPNDYFRQYAIRTGSADYSTNIIAGGWRSKGWCGSDLGLRRIIDCVPTGNGWKCIRLDGERPPVWESEEEFFNWLDVKYTEPQNRI